MNLYIVNSIISSSQRTREEKWFHPSDTFVLNNPLVDKEGFQDFNFRLMKDKAIVYPTEQQRRIMIIFVCFSSSFETEVFLKQNQSLSRISDLIIGSDRDFDLYSNEIRIAKFKKGYFEPIPICALPSLFFDIQIKFKGRQIKLIYRFLTGEIRSQLSQSSWRIPNSTFICDGGYFVDTHIYNSKAEYWHINGRTFLPKDLI
jgi:hypothetical protein